MRTMNIIYFRGFNLNKNKINVSDIFILLILLINTNNLIFIIKNEIQIYVFYSLRDFYKKILIQYLNLASIQVFHLCNQYIFLY